ncbi:MAG TPA: hypothetical protein VGY91_00920 [Chthoniobacterales bacterium]|nr:hypothetical protein [Chthoniobacterales bacterium]
MSLYFIEPMKALLVCSNLIKPEVSDLLWRLKDIEGTSRSEIVERAIISARPPQGY